MTQKEQAAGIFAQVSLMDADERLSGMSKLCRKYDKALSALVRLKAPLKPEEISTIAQKLREKNAEDVKEIALIRKRLEEASAALRNQRAES